MVEEQDMMACAKVCGASEHSGQVVSASGLSQEGWVSQEVTFARAYLVDPSRNELAQTDEGMGAC